MTQEQWIEAQVADYRSYLADGSAWGSMGTHWIFETRNEENPELTARMVAKPTLEEYRVMMAGRAEKMQFPKPIAHQSETSDSQ